MPPDRDQATILDIVTAGRLILEFKQGLDHAAFLEDLKTQSAIIHQLLVIGEAAKRLSAAYKTAHPAVPWDDIARMRDKMVHHYEGINREEVWRAAEADIPALLARLESSAPPGET
jgi:uncharacterized protein with HEPN domain